jgi:uncharacterized protein (TIGR00730 family)
MPRVCVFCGASPGHDPVHVDASARLGQALAERGIGLVTGGGKVGLMGAIADAALGAGGEVIGVIPRGLVEREVAHMGLTELHVVETLHERKALMHRLSDAFVALPGGFGTLDELMETITWAQLGIHAKPIGLVDVAGYYGDLLAFVETAIAAGFVSPSHPARLAVDADPLRVLDDLTARMGGAAGA